MGRRDRCPTAALSLGGGCVECSSSGAVIQASIASGISGCIHCTLRIARAVGRLSLPIWEDNPDGWGRPIHFRHSIWDVGDKGALGDMGQTAWLRIIRDRFVAGHDSCELRRHLDSVPPETPIRDIVDRCRVWESHADSDVRRISKSGPDRAFPTYVVSESERGTDDQMVATVTTSQSTPDQLEFLLWRLLAGPAVPAPPPKPEPPTLEQLLQRLLVGVQAQKPAPAVTTGSSDIETLL